MLFIGGTYCLTINFHLIITNIMTEISFEQNLDHNIDLLAAQRFYYSQTKKFRNFRIIISIVFALIAPLIIFHKPGWATIIGSIGSIWVLVAYLLKKLLESFNIEKAIKIQEEFDTSLFKMRWNGVLVGEKVSYEDIDYAKRKFKGDREKLKNWYSDISGFPYPVDVLLCQRSNLVWDWRLKRKYAIVISAITLMYFIITIILSSNLGLKISEYIFGLFLPALSGYFIAIDESLDHFKASSKRKDLEGKINNLSSVALIDNGNLNIDDLRQIQDCIFEFRKGPSVADFFYWLFRDSFESSMVSAVEDFRRKLKS